MSEPIEKKQIDLPGEGSSEFLKMVAWIYLVVSILGGLNFIVSGSADRGDYGSEPNQVMINWGIGIIFSGLIFMAFCQVLAAINSNIRTIAQNTSRTSTISEKE